MARLMPAPAGRLGSRRCISATRSRNVCTPCSSQGSETSFATEYMTTLG